MRHRSVILSYDLSLITSRAYHHILLSAQHAWRVYSLFRTESYSERITSPKDVPGFLLFHDHFKTTFARTMTTPQPDISASPRYTFAFELDTFGTECTGPSTNTSALATTARQEKVRRQSRLVRFIHFPRRFILLNKIGIDFLGPFPVSTTNNRWIIVAIDYMTRYAETTSVPQATALEVANFFLHSILLRHGAPQSITSDRGTPFIANLLNEVLQLVSTVHHVTSAYHPQANGLTERLNHTLADMISMYIAEDHTNWDAILPYVTYAYNTARQTTTGFSPYYLLYAREPLSTLDTILPYVDQPVDAYVSNVVCRAEDARRLARLHTLQSQQHQQLRHADTHTPVVYNVGDQVLLRTPIRQPGKCEKLLKKFSGPYRILRRLSDTNYEVVPVSPPRDHRSRSQDIVHVARMKPYFPQP